MSLCLIDGCYNFAIFDTDGTCCRYGDGYYKGIMYRQKLEFFGGEFEDQVIHRFCGEDHCAASDRLPHNNGELVVHV